MAKVIVSRQIVNDENKVNWEYVEINEKELREGEIPILDKFLAAE